MLVDDGSTDASAEILRKIAATDANVRVVIFQRNYGQTSAMQAGNDHAKADIIFTIDADLQNDLADIAAMVAKPEQGYDLVQGWRRDRKDALFSR